MRIARVGDIAEQVRGVTYAKGEAVGRPAVGLVPLLRAGNITDHGVDFNDLIYVPASRVSVRQALQGGDVLIAASSGSLDVVGKAARLTKTIDATFGAFCKVLRPSDQVDSRYFAHYFRTPGYRREISSLAAGANINNLRNEHLDDLRMPLPPIEEQRRIADILDRADALRAKRRGALALLDDLSQSIFVDMFSDVEAIPTAQLGPLLTLVTSGGRGWAKYYSESGRPFIRSLDVRINAIELVDAAYVRPPDNAEARRTEVRSDDTLLTITGSLIGRAAPVPASLGGAYISQHVAILRPDRHRLRSTYLSHFLNLPGGGQRQIAAMQYGQTKPGLNFEQIRSFEIPLPPLSRQDAYVQRVERVNCLWQTGQTQLDCLNHLSASLQQRAFAGLL